MSFNGQGKPRFQNRKLAQVIGFEDPRHPRNRVPDYPKKIPVGPPVWEKRPTDREKRLGLGIEIPNPISDQHFPRRSEARAKRDDEWRERWFMQARYESRLINDNENLIWEWIAHKQNASKAAFKNGRWDRKLINNWYNQAKVRRGPLQGLRIYREPGLKKLE